METGIVHVDYRLDGTRFTREVFSSFPDRTMVIRCESDIPGSLNLKVRLTRGRNRYMDYDFMMKPGLHYKAEIIDTWNMTVEEVAGSFEGNFQIKLPGTPYIAVRLSRE